MSQLIWARFRSAMISMDAFHSSKEQAFNELDATWRMYAAESNQDPEMLKKNAEFVCYKEVQPGYGFIEQPDPYVRRLRPGPEAMREDQ